NGTPERLTASAEEYFQVTVPHYDTADGQPVQVYRIDSGPWRTMPGDRVFYTGKLRPGPPHVAVPPPHPRGPPHDPFRRGCLAAAGPGALPFLGATSVLVSAASRRR